MKIPDLKGYLLRTLIILTFVFPGIVGAAIIFDQSPGDLSGDVMSSPILNNGYLASFSCSIALNCGVSGQTVYNIGVWIKKVGNPDDILLHTSGSYNDPNIGTTTFSNTVLSSSISDTQYTLKWFHFPQGVVISDQYAFDQFFYFKYANSLNLDRDTDYYRVLKSNTNDYSAQMQWCRRFEGCYSSPFYWKMDNSNIDLSSTTPAITPTGNSNVIFIPGLQASRLYSKKIFNCTLNCEDQVWEPTVFEGISDLYMNSNGDSVKNIYTRDIIDKTVTSKIYEGLINKLDLLKENGDINDWNHWAYDWRKDVDSLIENGTKYEDDQTVYLINRLQYLASTSQNGKVTIVTHSNGGLVAKALINKLQNMKISGQSNLVDKIETLVLVASPQLGTPDAVSSLLHGYDRKIRTIMTEVEARKLAKNMPSAYGLLPSEKYYEQVNIKPISVFASTSQQLYRNTYGESVNNYNEARSFILGIEGRSDALENDLISPIIGNSSLFLKSVNLHDVIDNMVIPSNINVISVAGWGKETLAGIKYTGTDIEPIYTIRGDKTVVSASALYGQGAKYWLDLRNSKITHKDILEDPQLLGFIENIIKKENISLSSLEPVQTENRLNLGVHSPVSIGVYDHNGNFTGKVCDSNAGTCEVVENILGSSYDEFGEGKYVNLGEDDFQRAVLQGTGVGTFTFESKFVNPLGEESPSSFINIPVTTQTYAEINIISNVPQLKLDVTGDGVTDFTLSPSNEFDPITYLEIVKETINSLDLSQGKKVAFSKKVDNIIKSIEKGKIYKAKLRTDKFKVILENRIAKPDPNNNKPNKVSKADAQLLLDMLNNLLDNL